MSTVAVPTDRMTIQMSAEELVIVIDSLAAFPLESRDKAPPFLRALNTFRGAAAGRPFPVTLENLELALHVLVKVTPEMLPGRRAVAEATAARLASYLLASTRPTTNLRTNDVLINRHPIHQSRLDILGYRLLAHKKPVDGSNDSELADGQTILGRFSDEGLDLLVGDRLAFVGLPRAAFIAGQCGALPKHRVVLELTHVVNPDEQLFQAIAELSNKGFQVAVSDLLVRKSDYPLASVADFVKLDFQDLGRSAIEARVETLRESPAKLLAENVESHSDFEFAKKAGFDYFHGYFFCEPRLTTEDVPLNRLATMRLLVRLQDPKVNVQQLEETISEDLALATKLLLFCNSAFVGLGRTVNSIGHAAGLIGIDRIRIWASLLMLSRMEDRPRELMMTAVVRAKMCESLAEMSNLAPKATYFTVGLLSVLDAVLDCSMAHAVSLLPLSRHINDALLYGKGDLGGVLRSAIAYERGDWRGARSHKLGLMRIRDSYLASLGWTKKHVEGLGI